MKRFLFVIAVLLGCGLYGISELPQGIGVHEAVAQKSSYSGGSSKSSYSGGSSKSSSR